ncbi:MAG: hypothetical protein H6672_19200 [Anaerolineaceae bacterium]|nr:hypothetical protein [Anaerolineaceae bacterium]
MSRIHILSIGLLLCLVLGVATVSPGSASPYQSDDFLDELAANTYAYLSSPASTSNSMPWSWYSRTTPGGDYANTTEIGLLMVVHLGAYEMQRPWSPSWDVVEREVMTILHHLRDWQTSNQNTYENSVFYQWYWINHTPPVVGGGSNDKLVPSIDNAFTAASLVVVREYAQANGHTAMAQLADTILADMNFMLWYDFDTHLFHLGAVNDPARGIWGDIYSNENRIINFMARALGQMDDAEYMESLSALKRSPQTYDEIRVDWAAWDGSYFTYIAPGVFIREGETFYGTCTVDPATQAQMVYAANLGYDAWGLSDGFDTTGAYVQQGAPPAFPGATIETRPGLVTPSAAAMALISSYRVDAEANLVELASRFPAVYDPEYGFLDSVMTKPGTPNYGVASDRFSALAQEWLLLSIIDAETGFIWDYFYRNEGVQAAHAEMFRLPEGCVPVCGGNGTVLCAPH